MTQIPHCIDAERLIIGGMLQNTGLAIQCCDELTPDHFFDSELQKIFKAIQTLNQMNATCNDKIAIKDYLARQGYASTPWVQELITLESISYSIDSDSYLEILHRDYKLRQTFNLAQDVQKTILSCPNDADTVIDDLQQKIYKLSQQSGLNEIKSLKDVFGAKCQDDGLSFLDQIRQKKKQYDPILKPQFAGLRSGFEDLDGLLNGLRKSNLIILAARPAMGKTTLALNIASHVAAQGKAVGFFSLEMSAAELTTRILCAKAEVRSHALETGSLSDYELSKVEGAVEYLSNHCPIKIYDASSWKISEVRARARKLKQQHNIELLVIDYLQLISGGKFYNRTEEITQISKQLKELARELDIPILCLSQLSRKVEDRTEKMPLPSDLRDSGSIEQDADAIVFVLRREVYNPLDKPGMAQIAVAKNRHGACGEFTLEFKGNIFKFLPAKPISSFF